MAENVTWHDSSLSQADRWNQLGLVGAVVWLTGLSGSGKSTVAVECEALLVGQGQPAAVLDGDNLRHGLCADLGFSESDRRENLRRISEVAVLMAHAGIVVFVPVVSPYVSARDAARSLVESHGVHFVEVFVDTPLELCEQRDPKGLYRKARAGEITGFTGVDDPYEPPIAPDLRLTPADGTPREQAQAILGLDWFAASRAARRKSGPASGSP